MSEKTRIHLSHTKKVVMHETQVVMGRVEEEKTVGWLGTSWKEKGQIVGSQGTMTKKNVTTYDEQTEEKGKMRPR